MPPLWSVVLLGACQSGGPVAVRDEDPLLVLSRYLDVSAEGGAEIVVRWLDDDGLDRVATGATGADGRGEVLLLGFLAESRYDLDVEIHETARTLRESVTLETGPLPAWFPEIQVDVAETGAMEPGLTLLGIDADGIHCTVLLDDRGRVRWIVDRAGSRDYRVRLAGGVLTAVRDGRIEQMDLGGRRGAAWAPAPSADAIPVDASELHHDFAWDADGNLLALDHAVRTVPSFPASYDDPTARSLDAPVLVDRVLRIDPSSGRVLQAVDVADLIPTDRLGYDALELDRGGHDWSHANAVVPRDDGGLVVSLRNQDALLGIHPDGALDWIAAPDHGWPDTHAGYLLAPVGGAAPFYHQHAPDPGPDGEILVFDNGNYRASPGDGLPADPRQDSRVVALRVDPAAGTLAESWSWSPEDAPVFSSVMGGVSRLPGTNNVLATFGWVEIVGGERLDDLGLGRYGIRVVELDPARNVVWQIRVESDPAVVPDGWNTFRAERVPAPW